LGNFVDLTGEAFGRPRVISRAKNICPICGCVTKTKINKYCSRKCQHESMKGKKLSETTRIRMKNARSEKSKCARHSYKYYFALYDNLKMSVADIGKLLNIPPSTIYLHIKKIGIETRCQKESMKKGAMSPAWKKGTYNFDGYIRLACGENKGALLHRLIAENVIGRKLKSNEVVHHIDGDRANNKNNNLLVCSRSYHVWLHRVADIKNNKPLFGRAF